MFAKFLYKIKKYYHYLVSILFSYFDIDLTYNIKKHTTVPIRIIDIADPNGQFLPFIKACSIKFPIMTTLAPPNKSGTIKFPRLGIKTRIDPPIIPGNDNGKVTL